MRLSDATLGASAHRESDIRHTTAQAYSSGSTTQIFCRAGTRTYIVVRFLHEIPGRAILSLLEDAYDAIYDIIENLGDGIIPQGYYSYPGAAASASAASSSSSAAVAATAHGGLQLYAQNVNNHQQTWGCWGGRSRR
ncbi:MAG: hypothetical protein FRX48_07201 [Lasallia pustulata]|uniref:Uncharacterized protein n=1 Tax=Lasallia pustulata TaxID=136370 RepID=A0A5M8PHH8_9LECA|nr:MAG: hypothetical protein FRX48_07201 [Lasallia pustulata]